MYSVCKNQVVSWLHFDQKNETYTTKIHRSIFSPSFDETRLPVDNSSHNNTALQNHVKRSPYTLRIQTHSAHAWPASTKTQVTTPAGRTKHGHMTVITTRSWGGGGPRGICKSCRTQQITLQKLTISLKNQQWLWPIYTNNPHSKIKNQQQESTVRTQKQLLQQT